eukprot:scaffold158_cov105-Cylindrotheca_fusiformis.AAC.23
MEYPIAEIKPWSLYDNLLEMGVSPSVAAILLSYIIGAQQEQGTIQCWGITKQRDALNDGNDGGATWPLLDGIQAQCHH